MSIYGTSHEKRLERIGVTTFSIEIKRASTAVQFVAMDHGEEKCVEKSDHAMVQVVAQEFAAGLSLLHALRHGIRWSFYLRPS